MVVKLYFPKQKPNIQTFQDYKRFQKNLFRSELDSSIFLNILNEVSSKYATTKKKNLRANQGEFMTKELNQAVMI